MTHSVLTGRSSDLAWRERRDQIRVERRQGRIVHRGNRSARGERARREGRRRAARDRERFRRAGGGRLWSRRRDGVERRSEEHTSELQSLMRISYAVFCLKKKK